MRAWSVQYRRFSGWQYDPSPWLTIRNWLSESAPGYEVYSTNWYTQEGAYAGMNAQTFGIYGDAIEAWVYYEFSIYDYNTRRSYTDFEWARAC